MRLRLLLSLVLVLCTCASKAQTLPPITFIDGMPGYEKVDAQFQHFEDPSDKLGIQDILDSTAHHPFTPGTHEVLNKGYTHSAYWLRARFSLGSAPGVSKELRYLEINYALLDDIRFYVVEDGQVVKSWATGDNRPFASRPIDHSRFLFPLELKPGQVKTVYIRVQSTSSMRIPLSLWDPFEFYHEERIHALIDGVYFGILFLMFFYHLCLLITGRDISYFYYIGYITAVTLFQLSMTGYGFEYLWSNMPAINDHLIPVSICLIAGFVVKFSQRILTLKPDRRLFHRFFSSLVVLAAAGTVVSLVLPYQDVIRPIILCAILITLAILYIGALETMKGSYTARLFLLAWSSLLLGSLTLAVVSMGWIPANLATTNAFMLGSALQVILLSITLAERHNQINREKTEMEKQAKQALEAVNQTLQDNNRIKDEFLATISHELRTPMNGVLGCLQHIHEEPISDRVNLYVNYADRSARHMMLLVDSLLTYTELQSGQVRFDNKPFQPAELMDHSRELFQELADRKGIELSYRIDPATPDSVWGDYARLGQILNNLVDNAIKFTRQGRVDVTLSGERDSDETSYLLLQVHDTGIGIAPDKLTLIFERFRQVDGAFNRGYGGLGIGLAVIKALLDQLGGGIDVASEPGKGCTFRVRIPCQIHASEAETRDISTVEQMPLRTNGIRVLVVEDNPVNQLVLKGLLTKQGFDVLTADNGALALEIVNSRPLDVILMDCQMPVMDGFEATQHIRRLNSPAARLPIIAVTANAMSQDRERCLQAGMNDYTCKPISAKALNRKIIHWVNTRSRSKKAG